MEQPKVLDKINFKHILTLLVVWKCFEVIDRVLFTGNLTIQIVTAILAILTAVIYYWVQSSASSQKKDAAIQSMAQNTAPTGQPATPTPSSTNDQLPQDGNNLSQS
jgi:hypothetical protein